MIIRVIDFDIIHRNPEVKGLCLGFSTLPLYYLIAEIAYLYLYNLSSVLTPSLLFRIESTH